MFITITINGGTQCQCHKVCVATHSWCPNNWKTCQKAVAYLHNDDEMEYLKSLIIMLTENVQKVLEEVEALKEAQNGSSNNGDVRVGTSYVRWGRTVCHQTAQHVKV